MRGLAGRLCKALHLARDHRKASARSAGAGGLDGCVQGQEVGLFRDRFDRAGDLCDLHQCRPDVAETKFDALHRFDQSGDMLDRCLHRGARLADFTDGLGGRGLHRARGAGNIVVGGDHRLGGLLQMPESLGLAGYPPRHFLQVSRDVGEFDPKGADPVGELIDQAFAGRGSGFGAFQSCGLCHRYRFGHSLYAVRNPPQCRPLTRIGTSISRIMMVLPLPMSRA
jgi:hypothetical protein